MKLNLKQICEITCGTEKIIEDDAFFCFHRFTKEQTQAYRENKSSEAVGKNFSTAGIRFSFETNSKTVEFDYLLSHASSRDYGFFDIYENGILIGHDGEVELSGEIKHLKFELCDGIKHVEIYFPWSSCAKISNFIIDDGAILRGIKRSKTIISFGDSITHGYDATFSSLAYSNQLAKLLDADSINKGIGGEMFFPELVKAKEEIRADLITVAYGTNDWSYCSQEQFQKNCGEFFELLVAQFPETKIFVISPIWREDEVSNEKMLPICSGMYELIKNVCKDYSNVYVIDGYTLTPHYIKFYSDGVHPNDLGFGIFANNLFAEISKIL